MLNDTVEYGTLTDKLVLRHVIDILIGMTLIDTNELNNNLINISGT